MGYLHIPNLYKSQDILLFKECYALEKVHGTSAHVTFRNNDNALPAPPDHPAIGRDVELCFSPGGAKAATFEAIFDALPGGRANLREKFRELGHKQMTVYGEAYGGGGVAGNGMSGTYGKALCFIVFDVQVGDVWLSVPDMVDVATVLGLEAVPYRRIPVDLQALDAERDRPSEVAVRRGCGEGKRREGVVLRPLIEVTKNNGERIIAKHRLEEFSERATPQKIVDAAKLEVLAQASKIADEWVTPMRLTHVLDRLLMEKPIDKSDTREVISAMVEDVYREAKGEIVESKDAETAIGRKAAALFHARLKDTEAEGPE